METLTKEISRKLRRKAADDFIEVGEILRSDGLPDRDIVAAFQSYQNQKRIQFYNRSALSVRKINTTKTIQKILEREGENSKAERIFYNMLKEKGIPFDFQRKIGPYRVDYLVDGNIVVECDGPHHKRQVEYDNRRDKYLESLGYHIVRISWGLISLVPDVFVDEIQKAIEDLRK
jgi:very-short-patch-repair endonuclease